MKGLKELKNAYLWQDLRLGGVLEILLLKGLRNSHAKLDDPLQWFQTSLSVLKSVTDSFQFWYIISLDAEKCQWPNFLVWKLNNLWSQDILLFWQGSKLVGFRVSGTPKNGDGNPILGPRFPTGNPGIVRPTDSLKSRFCDRKPRICQGNQNTEAGFLNGTQILIVISSPVD